MYPICTPKSHITWQYVRDVLDYYPVTGVFIWKKTLSNRAVAGREAGCLKKNGRYQVKINKTVIMRNILAWFWMTGDWPTLQVGHKNGNCSDDSWNNLRLATQSQNNMNGKIRKNNISGCTGVSWCSATNKWRVRISQSGKEITVGHFTNLNDAVNVRNKAVQEIYGEFARI